MFFRFQGEEVKIERNGCIVAVVNPALASMEASTRRRRRRRGRRKGGGNAVGRIRDQRSLLVTEQWLFSSSLLLHGFRLLETFKDVLDSSFSFKQETGGRELNTS